MILNGEVCEKSYLFFSLKIKQWFLNLYGGTEKTMEMQQQTVFSLGV